MVYYGITLPYAGQRQTSGIVAHDTSLTQDTVNPRQVLLVFSVLWYLHQGKTRFEMECWWLLARFEIRYTKEEGC